MLADDFQGGIEVTVAGFFTTQHSFRTSTGYWGKLTFPAFSDQATFCREDGVDLVMRKMHWMGTAHELLIGKIKCASADRAGLLKRDILIDYDGRRYRFQPEGALKGGWYLTDEAGTRLLDIRPCGMFRQGAILNITCTMEGNLVIFVYYMFHVRGQEEAAAVAATTAASAN